MKQTTLPASASGQDPTLVHPANEHPAIVHTDPWQDLCRFTDARIGLGRTGVSLPLSAWLDFRLAHARARDAVLAGFDEKSLADGLAAAGLTCLCLDSMAPDKETFLLRPDLGRKLSTASRATLQAWAERNIRAGNAPDMVLVVSNGLSARAIHENALPFVTAFAKEAEQAGLRLGPIVIVRHGRVAVTDEVADLLQAKMAAILVGERPGLSSPNSMGVYFLWDPHPGCMDEARNCISNVRDGGLTTAEGEQKLCYLCTRRWSAKRPEWP